jgi:phosphatidylglycerophosphatase A
MKRILTHLFGTFAGVGHIPVVPATWTSLVVALLVYFIGPQDPWWQALAVVLFTVTGVPACGALEREYGEDPKQATMDEAAGMMLTLLAVPLTPITVGVGFVLFRVFDVFKPFPARRLEALPGGWGIMADDLAAGVWARAGMALLLMLFPDLAG